MNTIEHAQRRARRIDGLLLATIAVVIVGATSLGAEAQADDFSFRLGGSDAAITDKGYDFLSADNFLSMGHLSGQLALMEHVWVGLEYNWALEQADPITDVSTKLDIDGLSASVRAQADLLPFLTPYIAAGVGFEHLELSVALAGQAREQDAFIGIFHGLIGVDLHVPSAWMRRVFNISKRGWAGDMTFGIVFEGGYQLATAADFSQLTPPEPDKEPEPEDKPIDAASVGLGELDLSGVILRSAFMIRF